MLLVAIGIFHNTATGQDSTDAGVPVVKVGYFVNNNMVPFLLIESTLKKGKKYEALPGQNVKIFMDSIGPGNLLKEVTTNERGKARVVIPDSFQERWKSSPSHNFMAILDGNTPEEERTTTLEITKARMTIDTATEDGVHYIDVMVSYLDNDHNWVPAPEVELKVGIRRAGGILSAGEASYTTDSSGLVTAALTLDSLPGDEQGNLIATSQIENNDLYGSLVAEKIVPWGTAVKVDTGFFEQRTLWTTAMRTPSWLLLIAYSIVIVVWGTLIYLVFQIIKIKKLGME